MRLKMEAAYIRTPPYWLLPDSLLTFGGLANATQRTASRLLSD